MQLRIIILLLGLAPQLAAARHDLPATSNVIVRVVERAEQVARADVPKPYTYDKRSVVEQLDEEQTVIKSTEKIYKVELLGGLPFSRLVKIAGRDLTAQELERETQRERAFRQKVTQVDLQQKIERRESWMTPELVGRFEFQLIRRETIRDRPTLVLTFAPKQAPATEGSIQDKVLTRLAGTVWIDEQDYEIAKLDASLQGAISLGWFGLIGSLQRCRMILERSRLPDGVWVNAKQTLSLMARKLFSTVRYRTTEESSGYTRAAAPEPKGPAKP